MAPKTQKAAQFNPVSKKVEVNEIPVPIPRDDEILIKTVAASLCHSDVVFTFLVLTCIASLLTCGTRC